MSFNLLYEIARGAIRIYSNLMLRMDIQWHEHPPAGPKLYVANHPSGTDPFVIHLLSPMSVLVTASAFSFPLFGTYIRKAGQIPVFPANGEQALDEACRLLDAGHSIGIFPEGAYSPQDGGFGKPRTGAARLALKTGVPVIPIGIYLIRENSIYITSRLGGTQTAGYWYLYGPYAITVGKSVCFHGDPDNNEHIQSATQKMMDSIRSLARESKMRMQRTVPAMADIPTKPA